MNVWVQNVTAVYSVLIEIFQCKIQKIWEEIFSKCDLFCFKVPARWFLYCVLLKEDAWGAFLAICGPTNSSRCCIVFMGLLICDRRDLNPLWPLQVHAEKECNAEPPRHSVEHWFAGIYLFYISPTSPSMGQLGYYFRDIGEYEGDKYMVTMLTMFILI